MRRALDGHPAAVKLSQALTDNESQSRTLLFMNPAVKLHVRANIGNLLRRHPATMIGHGQDVSIAIDPPADIDGLPDLREFEGIVRQFLDDLFQILVAHPQGSRFQSIHPQVHLPSNILRTDMGLILDNNGRVAGQIAAHDLNSRRVIQQKLKLSVKQIIFDQAIETQRRTVDVLRQLDDALWLQGIGVYHQYIGKTEDARQRSSQFMGERQDNILAQLVELLFGHLRVNGALAELRSHCRDQLRGSKRLGQIILRAHVHALTDIAPVGTRGQKHERCGASGRLLAQPFEHAVAI